MLELIGISIASSVATLAAVMYKERGARGVNELKDSFKDLAKDLKRDGYNSIFRKSRL